MWEDLGMMQGKLVHIVDNECYIALSQAGLLSARSLRCGVADFGEAPNMLGQARHGGYLYGA